jgi:lysophospholipase L1-like esterase
MTYDGLHPSDKGYAVIASMISEVMRKELKIKKESQK